jgi:predicted ester cyclase
MKKLDASDLTMVQAKRLVYDGVRRLADAKVHELAGQAAALYSADVRAHASHPINELHGAPVVVDAYWLPLKRALPDLERRDTLVASGRFNGATLVACMGHYYGTFEADWLGLPSTHKAVALRFTEAHRLEGCRITESWMMIDLPDLMRQTGCALIPGSLGAELAWPAPGGGHGLRLDTHDERDGAKSLALVLAMHAALGTFDGRSLDSMDVAPYWTPHFSWYGPSGIGTTRGLDGFRAHHQIPFLRAFPDRQGGQHYIRIADGPFVVTGGWPSVTATHTGDGFIGMPATGKRVGMRVMDFYRCEGGLIAENWVPIDILHLLLQMGYDVLGRLKHLRGSPDRVL